MGAVLGIRRMMMGMPMGMCMMPAARPRRSPL